MYRKGHEFVQDKLVVCTNTFISVMSRARAERDGTRAETTFRLSPKRTSLFKSAGASVQSTAGSRGVRISVSNAGYTMFQGRVRVLATHCIRQFPLHFPSRASPCATTFRTQYNNVDFIFVLKGHIDKPSHATLSVTSNTCHNTGTALKVKHLSRTLWYICTVL